eukprot:gb/GEZN01003019.1/.p1 GENE.gb/GEZN01003019.1/~~gb/GEZN01003019.1/.p1  ORF type:complete len:697 (-),score=95.47 gb/GEZN01003019.1/:91-2181(-)
MSEKPEVPTGKFPNLSYDELEKEHECKGLGENIYRAKRLEGPKKNITGVTSDIDPTLSSPAAHGLLTSGTGGPPPGPPPALDFSPKPPAGVVSPATARRYVFTPSPRGRSHLSVFTDAVSPDHTPLASPVASPAHRARLTIPNGYDDDQQNSPLSTDDERKRAASSPSPRQSDASPVPGDIRFSMRKSREGNGPPTPGGRHTREHSPLPVEIGKSPIMDWMERKTDAEVSLPKGFASFGWAVRPYTQCSTCFLSNGTPCPWDNTIHFHMLREPERERAWNCPVCTFENDSKSQLCRMCHSKKPDSASLNLLDEMIVTEKEYVKKLWLLNMDFAHPIKQAGDKILAVGDQMIVFSNIETLHKKHFELGAKIEVKDADKGQVLVNFAQNLQGYGEYIKNLPYALHKAQKQWDTNPKFKAFIREKYPKIKDKEKTVGGYDDEEANLKRRERFLLSLQEPVTRIPQIKFFLEKLTSELPEDDPRLPSFQNALRAVLDLWTNIQYIAFRGLAVDHIQLSQQLKAERESTFDKSLPASSPPTTKGRPSLSRALSPSSPAPVVRRPSAVPTVRKQFVVHQVKAKIGSPASVRGKSTSVMILDTSTESIMFMRVKRGKEVKTSRPLALCSVRLSESDPFQLKIDIQEAGTAVPESRYTWFGSTAERKEFWDLIVPASKTMLPFKMLWHEAGLTPGGYTFAETGD